jgi:hypothetical protein
MGRHRKDGGPIDVDPAETLVGSEPTATSAAAAAAPTLTAAPSVVAPLGGEAAVSLLPNAVPTGRGAARAAARQRRSRRNRTFLLVVAGLVVLAVVASLVVLLRGGDDRPSTPAAAGRSQSTLLMQLVDARRQTVAAVLLAHDPASGGSGAGVLVPSGLVVTVPSGGAMTFGQTSATGTSAPAAGLADALDVVVDGTWQLDSTALTSLVDSVGGVDVTVDRDVTATTPAGTTTLVAAGAQHLGGSAAVAYATFLAAQEPEQARLARFSAVLTAVLAKLPADEAGVSRLLSGLGEHDTTTYSPARLATFVAGLRADQAAESLRLDTLPVRVLDTGVGAPQLLVDHTAAEEVVARDFAGSRPGTNAAGAVRVLVQNGVGTPGLNAKAQVKLAKAGLAFVDGGNATQFGEQKSSVLILDATEQSQAQGAAVARALGLPTTDLMVTAQGQTLADVVVVLGSDFKG